MNKPLMKAVFAATLSIAALPALASPDPMPADATDQVAASFSRLLRHMPASNPVALPAGTVAQADPLLAGVNAVLWAQPSYHVPVRIASLAAKPKRKQ